MTGLRLLQRRKKSIDDLADKLVEIYAQRGLQKALHSCQINHGSKSLKMHSPYEETEDQLQATAEIKESMERPVPMDRLLAGDVGFGKTGSRYEGYL